jgi:hypothetical protein
MLMPKPLEVGDIFILNLAVYDCGIPKEEHGKIALVIFVPPDLSHPLAEYAIDTGYHHPWAIKADKIRRMMTLKSGLTKLM